MNPEGKLVPENRRWHLEHGTYTASYILGAIIVSLGILLCFQPWLPQVAAVGGLLVFGMSLVTLSTKRESRTPFSFSPAINFFMGVTSSLQSSNNSI